MDQRRVQYINHTCIYMYVYVCFIHYSRWCGECVLFSSSLLHQWKQLGTTIIGMLYLVQCVISYCVCRISWMYYIHSVGGCCKVTPEDITKIRTAVLSNA